MLKVSHVSSSIFNRIMHMDLAKPQSNINNKYTKVTDDPACVRDAMTTWSASGLGALTR